MGNPEHVQLVQRPDWNKWRADHPDIIPDLSGADLGGNHLRQANLVGAHLMGADLRKADLREANLHQADFSRANLSEVNLSNAFLSDANLSSANLSGADLREAHLWGTHLRQADLSRANLSGADLRAADLSGTHLRQVDFSRANLSRAKLIEAKLIEANLSGADLRWADLSQASLWETNFGATNLRDAKGLAECDFVGPCILDSRAIQQSGTLPLHFLRGCGLPESLIEYLPSLLNEAIQFFSCFISYSTKDQEFADRLHADLQNKGVRCWFAPRDIRGGRKIHEQIDEAIRVYDRLLLILSDASMDSPWVKTEIANARAREEQQKRRMLFPITLVNFDRIKDWRLFDADRGIDSAREIREYFIPDFSNWREYDSYQKAFDRLLRALKAEAQDKVTA
jgi:uncharacterized protein YjbI with pentapeptide repeats